jgi:hypothetical protein
VTAGNDSAVVPPRLFVYGTLQPGRLRWPLLAPFASGHRPAAVRGLLYDSGNGWPVAVLDPVGGEVPGVLVDLVADRLAEALDSTFVIVERCLDSWTLEMLDEVIRRPEWDESWAHTRGSVIQRVFSHDVWHIAEVNEALGKAGLPQIDLWD